MTQDLYEIREQIEQLHEKLDWWADEMDKKHDKIIEMLKKLEDRDNGDEESREAGL